MYKRQKITELLLIAGLSLTMMACGGGGGGSDDDDDTIDRPFLTDADFQPGNIGSIDAIDLRDNLDNEGFLFNNEPDDFTTDDLDSPCLEDELERLVLSASGDTVSVGGRIDVAQCLSDFLPGLSIDNATMSLYFEYRCPGEDLSAFDGIEFSEALESELDCADVRVLVNLQAEVSISGDFNGRSVVADVRLVSFEGDSTTVGCRLDYAGGVVTGTDGCSSADAIEALRFLIDGEDVSDTFESELSTFEMEGVIYNDNDSDLWPLSGTVTVRVNNWNGTVTYTGAATDPAFDFTSDTGDTYVAMASPSALPALRAAVTSRSSRALREIRAMLGQLPGHLTR